MLPQSRHVPQIAQLYNDRYTSDMTIRMVRGGTPERSFFVHKNILAAHSPHLHSLFFNSATTTTTATAPQTSPPLISMTSSAMEIDTEQFPAAAVERLLHYVYTVTEDLLQSAGRGGTTSTSSSTAAAAVVVGGLADMRHMFDLATLWHMHDIRLLCLKSMHTTASNTSAITSDHSSSSSSGSGGCGCVINTTNAMQTLQWVYRGLASHHHSSSNNINNNKNITAATDEESECLQLIAVELLRLQHIALDTIATHAQSIVASGRIMAWTEHFVVQELLPSDWRAFSPMQSKHAALMSVVLSWSRIHFGARLLHHHHHHHHHHRGGQQQQEEDDAQAKDGEEEEEEDHVLSELRRFIGSLFEHEASLSVICALQPGLRVFRNLFLYGDSDSRSSLLRSEGLLRVHELLCQDFAVPLPLPLPLPHGDPSAHRPAAHGDTHTAATCSPRSSPSLRDVGVTWYQAAADGQQQQQQQ